MKVLQGYVRSEEMVFSRNTVEYLRACMTDLIMICNASASYTGNRRKALKEIRNVINQLECFLSADYPQEPNVEEQLLDLLKVVEELKIKMKKNEGKVIELLALINNLGDSRYDEMKRVLKK